MVMGKLKAGDYVVHCRKYVSLGTGKVIGCSEGVAKIRTRDGDIFSCSPNLLKVIPKRESENRDALQKLRK